MAKRIYEVRGIVTIDVFKRVKANDKYEAIELAQDHFGGLTTYGYHSEMIGVEGEGESINEYGDDPEWKEAYETDNDDYDTATDTGFSFTCKLCGKSFYYDNEEDFDDFGEEEVLGHIQTGHEEEFEECQDWDTPDMIDEYFTREDD